MILAQDSVKRRLANFDRTPACEPDDIHSAGVLRRTGIVGGNLAGADGSCLIPVAQRHVIGTGGEQFFTMNQP